MSGHHDLGYKFLFAHPELVRELVAGFTPFSFLDGIDAAAFERVNPAYVSERFSERQDDIVWRVRIGRQWLYIYILLEFQSQIDRWMALRMQAYIGLLYQDLVRRNEVAPGARLPAVLPLVFYNGAAPWNDGLEMREMIAGVPQELAPFQASQRYFLIDQKRLDPAALAKEGTVIAALFRLELSDMPDVLRELAPALNAWLSQDAQAPLKRAVAAWLEQLVQREARGEDELGAVLQLGGTAMGVRKYDTWADALEDRGLQKGLERGREEGREAGREEGRSQIAAVLRSILERILAKRFSAVPNGVSQRLEVASVDELEEWTQRALDADSIEALFGPVGPQAANGRAPR